ncbi:MAG: translocation/assembly module TamB domain-containing protein [Deltaproteobacteria bacterium]|nr:translocation/assembly module TamB domain-containing protein [Deltaproteobacteria bacterium]
MKRKGLDQGQGEHQGEHQGESEGESEEVARKSRWPFRLFVVFSVVVCLVGIAVGWAYLTQNDEALGQRVSKLLTKELKGTITVRRIHWRVRALADLALGTATPVEMEGVRILAPNGGEVISVDRVGAKVRLWAILARGEFIIPEVHIHGGRVRVVREEDAGETYLGIAEAFLPTFSDPKESTQEKAPGKGAPLLRFEDVYIHQVDFELHIDRTRIVIAKVSTRASLEIKGDVSHDGLKLHARDLRAGDGRIEQHSMKAALKKLRAHNVRIEGQRLSVAEFRGDVGGSPLKASGGLGSLFEGEPTLSIEGRIDQGATLAAHLFGLPLGGRSSVNFQIHGLAEEPKITATVASVRATLAGVNIEEIAAKAVVDVAKDRIDLSGVSAQMLGGKAEGGGALVFQNGEWKAELKLAGVDPAALVPALRGKVSGKVTVKGRLGAAKAGLAVVDLELQRRPRRRDPIPRKLGLKGSIHLGSEIVDLAGLTLSGDGNRVRGRGSIQLKRKAVNLYLAFDLARLGRWMRTAFGVDSVSSAKGSVRITGRYPRLSATGTIDAQRVGYGAQRLDRVRAEVGFHEGRLKLSKIRSSGYGGTLRGSACLHLFRGGIDQPLKRPTLQASLRARHFSLAELVGSQEARAQVDADIDLSGQLENLKGSATLRADDLVVANERYRQVRARIGLLPDRISIYEAALSRPAGGRIRGWGDVFFDKTIALHLRPEAFPLQGIPGLKHPELNIRGLLSGELKADGDIDAPRLAGKLKLSNTSIRGARLGGGWLKLTPGSDTIRIEGALLGDLLRIDGFALSKPRASLHLKVGIRRFPMHRLLPEFQRLGKIRGFVSGRVAVDLDDQRGLTWVNARFSEVDLSMVYRPRGSRTRRAIRLRNQDDLLVTYNGNRAHVVTAEMVSSVPGKGKEQAKFSVGGFIGAKNSDLQLRGVVPLGIAEFFLARHVKRVTGKAVADVRVTGPLQRLNMSGRLRLDQVRIDLQRFDRAIEIPRAELRLTPKAAHLQRLIFRVDGDELTASGRLENAGGIAFGRQEHAMYDLRVGGALNVRLLRLLAPDVFSHAAGSAQIDMRVKGMLADPQFAGELKIGRRNHVEVRPRGLGRTITISSAHVRLTGSHLETVKPVIGRYDEGRVRVSGEARFDRGKIIDVFLRIRGRNLPQREPKVYSAEFNADLTLVGDPSAAAGSLRCAFSKLDQQAQGRGLMLKGKLDILDARYVREFDILKNAVIKPRVQEEDQPFWEGSDFLTNLGLCLTVRSTGQLKVKNRYGDLGLQTALTVTGTLPKSRIDGVVRVETGRVQPPFLRGRYDVDRGSIVFVEKDPPDEAELSIEAESQHIDRNGTEYVIRLHLKGSFKKGLQMILTSQPTLDRGQILALLATGRTTDQLRNEFNSGAQGSPAAGAADAQVKALSSMLLSSMLEDPIKKATGLDLVRLEVGTETVTARGCKRIGSFEICGEYEKDMVGGSRSEGSVRQKLHDYLKLVGRFEQLSTRLDREQDNPSRARLELKFELPLR